MQYLVILNAESPVALLYANGKGDGIFADKSLKHPYLYCTKIEAGFPNFLKVVRPLPPDYKTYQSLHLPYNSIVAIVEVSEEDEKLPLGFSRNENQ